ncbi:hypothetical protein [Mucilaginibacter limnophilus]|uniref:hypothetical protein n=1 Tax=Mucilaginibacter limnophilus TaxID=1932778 RepID=UPI0013E31E66|nr:hypothetical protein [Mucilaginibacter limnophilus]
MDVTFSFAGKEKATKKKPRGCALPANVTAKAMPLPIRHYDAASFFKCALSDCMVLFLLFSFFVMLRNEASGGE